MSDAKFTKGEWKVSSCGLSVNVNGNKVARAHSGSSVPYTVPAIANAHLIAAAPEMYSLIEAYLGGHLEAEALLAKARGEQITQETQIQKTPEDVEFELLDKRLNGR